MRLCLCVSGYLSLCVCVCVRVPTFNTNLPVVCTPKSQLRAQTATGNDKECEKRRRGGRERTRKYVLYREHERERVREGGSIGGLCVAITFIRSRAQLLSH